MGLRQHAGQAYNFSDAVYIRLFMPKKHSFSSASYLRNFVFGVEDGLVSTVGLLSGIAIAGMDARVILVTGIILIAIEAFSMAVGSFLSEYSTEEYLEKSKVSTRVPLLDGLVMFFSYFVSGFIPLAPYIFMPINPAFWYSICLSLVALFFLGIISAKVAKLNIVRSGFRALAVGGVAIIAGILLGKIVSAL